LSLSSLGNPCFSSPGYIQFLFSGGDEKDERRISYAFALIPPSRFDFEIDVMHLVNAVEDLGVVGNA